MTKAELAVELQSTQENVTYWRKLAMASGEEQSKLKEQIDFLRKDNLKLWALIQSLTDIIRNCNIKER